MRRFLKIVFSLYFLLPLYLSVYSGNLEKGFEALEIHDYFKARKSFYQTLKKHKAASAMGLSIIYSRDNNPFYNLDSALHYIKLSEMTFWSSTSDKEKQKIKELNVDSNSICSQRELIDVYCYQYAEKQNSIEEYNHFIENNTGALQIEKATEKRNELAFDIAKQENSSEVYMTFIKTYPEAKQISLAKSLYDKRLYLEYTSDKTLESYSEFIQDLPSNPHVKDAQERVYLLATKERTITSYQKFINKYPESPYVEKAWRQTYNLYTMIKDTTSISTFLKEFPNCPFKIEVKQDYLLAKKVYYKAFKEGNWGFVDEKMRIQINPEYIWVDNFFEEAAAVKKSNKVGYINKKNEIIIPFEYDEAERFNGGLAIVGKNDKYGLINRVGEEVLQIEYDEIGDLTGKFITVEKNGKCGLVDRNGHKKLNLVYESIGDFNDYGITYIKEGGKYGLIDTSLAAIVIPKFEWIDNLENQFIRVRENALYGVIDVQGEYVVPPIYEHLSEIEYGFSLVVKDGSYGYIDEKGLLKIDVELPYVEGILNWGAFNEKGLAKVSNKGKIGLIDTTGKKVVPTLFEDIGELSEDLIAVKKRGKWGYCNYQVKLKIGYKYKSVSGFHGEVAIIEDDEGYTLTNKKGAKIITEVYDYMEWMKKDLLLVKLNGLYGIMNGEGDMVISLSYSKIEFTEDRKMLRLYKGLDFTYVETKEVFEE